MHGYVPLTLLSFNNNEKKYATGFLYSKHQLRDKERQSSPMHTEVGPASEAALCLSTARLHPLPAPHSRFLLNQDDPEGTQGLEVCHLDRIVLMQTWLSLASDRPSDACLKQCGSVDDFCQRQQQLRSSERAKGSTGGGGDGGGDGASFRGGEVRERGGAAARPDGGGEGRGSRPVRTIPVHL